MRNKRSIEGIPVSTHEGNRQKHSLTDQSLEPSYQINSLDIWMNTEEAAHTFESKGLSSRESEVLTWLAQGKTNSEIGMILHISPRTVSKHLEHIYCKLGVECRIAAVVHLLELQEESQREQEAIEENRYSKNSRGRILLVDDEPISREVIRAMLEYHGYECVEVENGAEALTWLETDQVDLVITDNKMPVLGGLEFLEHLVKKSNGDETPPVVVHSGNLTEKMKEKAVKDGAYTVLTKPCAMSVLLSSVAQAIEHGRPSNINTYLPMADKT